MHVFQIKFCKNVSKSEKRFSQNWFNVALIFFFDFSTLDGHETLCNGLQHNSLFIGVQAALK